MAKPNFTTGWTSASIAPSIPAATPQSPTTQPAPAAPVPQMMGGTTGTNYLDQLKQAAMGTTGMGGSISASVYQHPDAPAFLADAVRNLNGAPGFAQQNLTNLLLQQIMGGFQSTQALHETSTAAQKALDAQKIAAVKAEAALNEHKAEMNLHKLQGNMSLPTPVGAAAQSSKPPTMSGWTQPGWSNTGDRDFYTGAYNKAYQQSYYPGVAGKVVSGLGSGGGYAPGTVNGVFQ